MKNYAQCLVMLFLMGVSSNLYAQEWVVYNQHIQPQMQIQTVYIQPQPVIIYQWVPYSVQQNFVLERKCFLHTTQTVITKPSIQWILQPVIVYR